MSGALLAIAVAVVGLSTTALWFGVSRRRKAETEIGIHSLANMKWRDCIAVVLEALQREGYRQTADSMATGDGGTELLLTLGQDRVLLGYKHGTAYRLGEANVRDFANALQLRGARSGILLTLGTAEGAAAKAAKSSNVQLIDGAALWPQVRSFIQPRLLESVRRQAAARTREGLWIGTTSSVLAGATIFLLGNSMPTPATAPVTAVVPIVSARFSLQAADLNGPASGADTAQIEQLHATAQAMAEVAKLSTAELAQRRADAAKTVSSLPRIDTAAWSAQRTLLVTLQKTDGKDKALIDQVCGVLTRYEEMRFTRVQLEPPADSGLAVRWRLCE